MVFCCSRNFRGRTDMPILLGRHLIVAVDSTSIVCDSNLSHKGIGMLSSTPANIDLKWHLNVCITLSAKFRLWLSGGTSCIVQFFLISALSSADALLSMRCVVGWMVPVAIKHAHNAR